MLREVLAGVDSVLEIGSGTGQHARYFAEELPELRWQASDLAENLPGIESWREGYGADNLPPPVRLDVTCDAWPVDIPGAVFSANTLHIMPWNSVRRLFAYLGGEAPVGCLLCLYGPFNYEGSYTSESNAHFDDWLHATHPGGGIRDFEAVNELASEAGFQLRQDHEMPANNRLLVFWKPASV